jgi:hypothetical protein
LDSQNAADIEHPSVILSDNLRLGKQTLFPRRFTVLTPGLPIAGCADTILLSE